MSDWQGWVVAILLLLCILRIGQSVYTFFRRAKENDNPCDSCVSGCDLKQLMDDKRSECKAKQPAKKKKCCG